MSHLMTSAGVNYVGVRDLASAVTWYMEKLGLRQLKIEMDEPEGCTALGFAKDEYALTLGPLGKPTEEQTPMFYASNLKKAREFLNSRGVSVGDIEQDRQGTGYFEMRDLEGNVIEVCEEP